MTDNALPPEGNAYRHYWNRQGVSRTVSANIACFAVFLAALLSWTPIATAQETDWSRQRELMVEIINEYARLTRNVVGEDGISPEVLDVMSRVERHLFVPREAQHLGYEDRPVPIGYGQTISQPFIVALMTHLLNVDDDDTILEVGTGSGYQTAVLSPLVKQVCTIEIIRALGEAATERLDDLGFANVRTKIGDGYHGWSECGPFDGIVVTAAASHIPPPLVEQLKVGGRLVVPVGGPFVTQHLTLVEKAASGEVTTRQIMPVLFVPLTHSQ